MSDSPDHKKSKTVDLQEGALLCLGNPLLDISTDVSPEYLKKYDLKDNDAILADEKHLPIYAEIVSEFKVEYIAGGAGQNAIRVAQWVLNRIKRNATTYIGCIGKDDYGKKLQEKASSDGVSVRYLEDAEHPTGTCAVLINDKVRSLVANLGAANHYKHDHLREPANWACVQQARMFYIAGFFLTVSPPSIQSVAEHAAENNKLFVFNLSAPFICQFFKDPLSEVLPYVDIIVGNESEADAFQKSFDLGTDDLKEIAKKLAALPKKNPSRQRIAIITQGAGDVIVCRDGKIEMFPILQIKPDEIVDTNGAGDAFIGGLLSQLVLEEGFERCMQVAMLTANTIIKRSGCTFPENCEF